jgi:phosphoglycolate phosphatase-like HAD superfamily hydrolase
VTRYFFLDFDGVACDSIPECFVSSYRAYRELLLGETVLEIPLRYRNQFYAYRPFIRSGEDYLLIHDMIRRGLRVSDQETFDADIARVGKTAMKEYEQLFYQVRDDFLANDREFWLDLNPLFPGMKEILSKAIGISGFYILSTKKTLFIKEILLHHGIDWNIERILYTGERSKRAIMESFMKKGDKAVFVDDQLDHLLTARPNPDIDGYLASWGYVKQPWLEQKEIPVIEFDDLKNLAADFCQAAQPE